MRKILLSLFVATNILGCAAVFAGDRVNVTDFGAIPDDGGDDTGAIQTAINTGKSIYFPPGTYNVSGNLWLPNGRSTRLYGDGPGVSVILFSWTTYGFALSDAGSEQINIEGLTLRANTSGCYQAISVNFHPAPDKFKRRTLEVHNVVIDGVGGDSGEGYWTMGLYAYHAQNAVIDKLEIDGRYQGTSTGIFLDSSPSTALPEPTTGIQITNTQIKFCDSGIYAQNHIEGLYISGFEIVLCGRNGGAAINVNLGGSQAYRGPAFTLLNGHVDMIGDGIRFTNVSAVKVSHVDLQHLSSVATDGSHITFDNCEAVSVQDCTFAGKSAGYGENGIFIQNTHIAQINGNTFRGMQPANGACIVAYYGADLVRIVGNVFDNVRLPWADYVGSYAALNSNQ